MASAEGILLRIAAVVALLIGIGGLAYDAATTYSANYPGIILFVVLVVTGAGITFYRKRYLPEE